MLSQGTRLQLKRVYLREYVLILAIDCPIMMHKRNISFLDIVPADKLLVTQTSNLLSTCCWEMFYFKFSATRDGMSSDKLSFVVEISCSIDLI